MNEEIQEFWYQFCSKHNLDKDTAVEAWAFGATEEEADELATLVQQGIKTATTSAYELYTQDEKLPEVWRLEYYFRRWWKTSMCNKRCMC